MVRQRSVPADISRPAMHSGCRDVTRRRPLTFRPLLLCVTIALTLSVYPTRAQYVASLSQDLLQWLSMPTSADVRVIVAGTQTELGPVLARHQLSVTRWLSNGAVVVVDASALTALAADPAVTHHLRRHHGLADDGDLGSVDGGGPRLARGSGVVSVRCDCRSNRSRYWRRGHRLRYFSAQGAGRQDRGEREPARRRSSRDRWLWPRHSCGRHRRRPADAAEGTTPAFAGGIAPGAQLVNVRVLSSAGLGYTSDVIAGIDWAIAQQAQYNIRVINLSLGHPVVEPALTDPLCQAVARAVSRGIVVAVSAGNEGRSRSGVPVLGGIESPGNSPFAVTVGALNTWGTVDRSDDTVAEYSSRGPARFDVAVKPDIAAPGNRIESLQANGSYLPATYPWIHTAGAGHQFLHAAQRHKHGRADGFGCDCSPSRGVAGSDRQPSQGAVAEWCDLHARRRADGRRYRQP